MLLRAAPLALYLAGLYRASLLEPYLFMNFFSNLLYQFKPHMKHMEDSEGYLSWYMVANRSPPVASSKSNYSDQHTSS